MILWRFVLPLRARRGDLVVLRTRRSIDATEAAQLHESLAAAAAETGVRFLIVDGAGHDVRIARGQA